MIKRIHFDIIPFFQFCIEADREMDWEWDFLNVNPTFPSTKLKLVVVWGPSDTAKGKCSGSSVLFNFVGEISKAQFEESQKENSLLNQCRKEFNKKNYVPYTDTCYDASKELSILRKYQFFLKYENVSGQK